MIHCDIPMFRLTVSYQDSIALHIFYYYQLHANTYGVGLFYFAFIFSLAITAVDPSVPALVT